MSNLNIHPRRSDWTWLIPTLAEVYGNIDLGFHPNHGWRVRVHARGETFVTYGKDIDDAVVSMRQTLSALVPQPKEPSHD